MRFPLAPLLELTSLSNDQVRRRVNVSGTTWALARDKGLTETSADRWACALGFHPSEVWPEIVDHFIATESVECACGCGESFVPARKGNVYRSVACKNRVASRLYARRRYREDPEYRDGKLRAAAATYAHYKAQKREAA